MIAIKILVIVLLIVCVYNLTDQTELERFTNKIETEKNNYFKYGETLLDNGDDMCTDTLYKNYSGSGVGDKVWDNMNLHQCVDRCNQMENCIGFSREDLNDDEKGKCYPSHILSKCHSSRKGNFSQRQKAIHYNTYLKNDVKHQLTRCLGDEDMTLNKDVFIKSYANPNKYIGVNKNNITLVEDSDNKVKFHLCCKFRIERGKDGSGTVSFRHVESDRYLYRDEKDILSCKELNMKSTADKQRASFHLLDGLSNQVVLKCMRLQGEKMGRFISSDAKGRHLKILSNVELNKYTKKFGELLTFDIVDYITNNKIISKKKDREVFVGNFNNKPNYPKSNEEFQSIQEDQMESYQYLDSGMTESNFDLEKQENVRQNNQIDIANYRSLSDIDLNFEKHLNADRSSDHGELVYKNLNEFNNKLYDSSKGIKNYQSSNSNRLNKCKQDLDRFKIQDMSRDYYYLKNLADDKN